MQILELNGRVRQDVIATGVGKEEVQTIPVNTSRPSALKLATGAGKEKVQTNPGSTIQLPNGRAHHVA